MSTSVRRRADSGARANGGGSGGSSAGRKGGSEGPSLPGYLQVWLLVSSLIVCWDAGFVLNRPRTFPGGDLHAFWKPYALYITVDKMYGNLSDAFVTSQSWLNLVEVAMNFAALRLYQGGVASRKGRAIACLVALVSLSFTFWKTALYMMYGQDDASHNPWTTYISLYAIPNGLWILVPALGMHDLFRTLVAEIVR